MGILLLLTSFSTAPTYSGIRREPILWSIWTEHVFYFSMSVINKYNFKLLLVFLHLLLSYSLKFLPCVVYRPSLYYYLLLFFLFFTIFEYYLGMKISQVENKVKWKMNYTKSIRIRYRIEDRQQWKESNKKKRTTTTWLNKKKKRKEKKIWRNNRYTLKLTNYETNFRRITVSTSHSFFAPFCRSFILTVRSLVRWFVLFIFHHFHQQDFFLSIFHLLGGIGWTKEHIFVFF